MRVAIALTTWVQACLDVDVLGDISSRQRLAEEKLHERALECVPEHDDRSPTVRKAAKKAMPGVAGRQVGSLDCAFWAVEFIISWAMANPTFDQPKQVAFSAQRGSDRALRGERLRADGQA